MKIFGLDIRRTGGSKSGQIDSSANLAEYLGAGYESDTGISISPSTAMRYAAVFACVRVLSESVGMLPVGLYERKGDARVQSFGGLADLISVSPNEFQTAQEFWEQCIVHLCLRGNFYAWKNVVGGELRELIPFGAGCVTPVLREDYSIWYKVQYANGSQDVLPGADVFHVRLASLDGITGLSPTAWNRETIALGIATQKHGSKVFKNGARIGGVLTTDGILGDEPYERVKKSWSDTYSGVDNAHKVAILEQGLKYQSVMMSSEDAQYHETRQFQRSEIAGIFRVPPHMIGDLEHATFSNIEHQARQFVDQALIPLLTRIERRILVSLIPPAMRARQFAKFKTNSLLRGDTKSRAEFYTKMIQNGAMSPNEIRALEDMNPRDGGDIYLTPLNMAIDGKPVEQEDTA